MIRTYTIQGDGCEVLFAATKRQVTILVATRNADIQFDFSSFEVKELIAALVNGESFRTYNTGGDLLHINFERIEASTKTSVTKISIEQHIGSIYWVLRETAL